MKKGSTGDASSAPFVAGALNTAVWCKYGYLIAEPAIQVVNLIGALLFTLYTLVFYQFSPRKITVMKQGVFTVVFFVTVLIVLGQLNAMGKYDHEKQALGVLAAVLSVAFCASPLASIGHVMRTKSTEILPFYLILMNFIVTAQWWMFGVTIGNLQRLTRIDCRYATDILSTYCTYRYIVSFISLADDGFVKYPNMIGCFFSAFQLFLFFVYPSRSRKKNASEDNLI